MNQDSMPTARDLMTSRVQTVPPSAPVTDIARLLCDRGISAVPVVDTHGAVLGVVTEADLIRRLAGRQDAPIGWFRSLFIDPASRAERYARTHGAVASDIMTEGAITVSPFATAAEVAHMMEQRNVRRLLVTEGGRLVGLISRADLLRALMASAKAPEEGLPDERIRIAVIEAMKNEPWADGTFTAVVVKEGVVTFEGYSQHEGIKRGLHVLAMSVHGVKGVVDNTQPLPVGLMSGV
jgi:CBS domain-containing protein